MIFKEAVKSKVRLSITGYDDNSSINNENAAKEAQASKAPATAAMPTPQSPGHNFTQTASRGSYGWNLEPPKTDSLI